MGSGRVEFVVLVVREPLMQIIAVHREHTGIVVARNDLYGVLIVGSNVLSLGSSVVYARRKRKDSANRSPS